jgi:hypothetical protein
MEFAKFPSSQSGKFMASYYDNKSDFFYIIIVQIDLDIHNLRQIRINKTKLIKCSVLVYIELIQCYIDT